MTKQANQTLDNRQALIRQLADGYYHSGEVLGEQLGVSRAAVWKQLRKLEKLGIALESCKRRGYRIPGGLSLLDHGRIAACMADGGLPGDYELDIHQVATSTNLLAMERSRAGGASGYICLAESQTAGKGRRGRQWVSPYGRNIYLSAVRGFEGGVASVEGLSLAVGVAIVNAMQALGLADCAVKWPNDILWRGRKLAGVLLEISGDPAGTCEVIIGIGLNVDMPQAEAEAVDQAWVDLAQALPGRAKAGRPDRNQVVASLLDQLLPLLESYETSGFSRYRAAWEALDAHRGETVVLKMGDRTVVGTAAGVDETGALQLDTPGGREAFSGGEISVRLAS